MSIQSYRHLATYKKNPKAFDRTFCFLPSPKCYAKPQHLPLSANLHSWREKKTKTHQPCNLLGRLTWLNPDKLRKEINYRKAEAIQKHLHLLYLLWEQYLIRTDLNYSNPPHSQVPARVRGKANYQRGAFINVYKSPWNSCPSFFCSAIISYKPALLYKGCFSADFTGTESNPALTVTPTAVERIWPSLVFCVSTCSEDTDTAGLFLITSPINALSVGGRNVCKCGCTI